MGDELDDDLGVAGRLEVGSGTLQTSPQIAEVYQVAVVRDGNESLGGIHADRLSIEQGRVASGGVPRVPDRHRPRKLGQDILGKDLRNQAHAFDVGKMLAVSGRDSR